MSEAPQGRNTYSPTATCSWTFSGGKEKESFELGFEPSQRSSVFPVPLRPRKYTGITSALDKNLFGWEVHDFRLTVHWVEKTETISLLIARDLLVGPFKVLPRNHSGKYAIDKWIQGVLSSYRASAETCSLVVTLSSHRYNFLPEGKRRSRFSRLG